MGGGATKVERAAAKNAKKEAARLANERHERKKKKKKEKKKKQSAEQLSRARRLKNASNAPSARGGERPLAWKAGHQPTLPFEHMNAKNIHDYPLCFYRPVPTIRTTRDADPESLTGFTTHVSYKPVLKDFVQALVRSPLPVIRQAIKGIKTMRYDVTYDQLKQTLARVHVGFGPKSTHDGQLVLINDLLDHKKRQVYCRNAADKKWKKMSKKEQNQLRIKDDELGAELATHYSINDIKQRFYVELMNKTMSKANAKRHTINTKQGKHELSRAQVDHHEIVNNVAPIFEDEEGEELTEKRVREVLPARGALLTDLVNLSRHEWRNAADLSSWVGNTVMPSALEEEDEQTDFNPNVFTSDEYVIREGDVHERQPFRPHYYPKHRALAVWAVDRGSKYSFQLYEESDCDWSDDDQLNGLNGEYTNGDDMYSEDLLFDGSKIPEGSWTDTFNRRKFFVNDLNRPHTVYDRRAAFFMTLFNVVWEEYMKHMKGVWGLGFTILLSCAETIAGAAIIRRNLAVKRGVQLFQVPPDDPEWHFTIYALLGAKLMFHLFTHYIPYRTAIVVHFYWNIHPKAGNQLDLWTNADCTVIRNNCFMSTLYALATRPHHGSYARARSQLSGNNGEWTNGDDMPGKGPRGSKPINREGLDTPKMEKEKKPHQAHIPAQGPKLGKPDGQAPQLCGNCGKKGHNAADCRTNPSSANYVGPVMRQEAAARKLREKMAASIPDEAALAANKAETDALNNAGGTGDMPHKLPPMTAGSKPDLYAEYCLLHDKTYNEYLITVEKWLYAHTLKVEGEKARLVRYGLADVKPEVVPNSARDITVCVMNEGNDKYSIMPQERTPLLQKQGARLTPDVLWYPEYDVAGKPITRQVLRKNGVLFGGGLLAMSVVAGLYMMPKTYKHSCWLYPFMREAFLAPTSHHFVEAISTKRFRFADTCYKFATFASSAYAAAVAFTVRELMYERLPVMNQRIVTQESIERSVNVPMPEVNFYDPYVDWVVRNVPFAAQYIERWTGPTQRRTDLPIDTPHGWSEEPAFFERAAMQRMTISTALDLPAENQARDIRPVGDRSTKLMAQPRFHEVQFTTIRLARRRISAEEKRNLATDQDDVYYWIITEGDIFPCDYKTVVDAMRRCPIADPKAFASEVNMNFAKLSVYTNTTSEQRLDSMAPSVANVVALHKISTSSLGLNWGPQSSGPASSGVIRQAAVGQKATSL
nr:hypothetical protein [Tolivirales sp.]